MVNLWSFTFSENNQIIIGALKRGFPQTSVILHKSMQLYLHGLSVRNDSLLPIWVMHGKNIWDLNHVEVHWQTVIIVYNYRTNACKSGVWFWQKNPGKMGSGPGSAFGLVDKATWTSSVMFNFLEDLQIPLPHKHRLLLYFLGATSLLSRTFWGKGRFVKNPEITDLVNTSMVCWKNHCDRST